MHTEPVAWLVQYRDRHEFRWSRPEHLSQDMVCEPLYNHPAPLLAPDAVELIQKFQAERDELKQECARLYRIIEMTGVAK